MMKCLVISILVIFLAVLVTAPRASASPPTIENITVDNPLIDKDLDDSSSGAVVDTTITIRVQDNDGYGEIQSIHLWIRDNNNSVVVDNVQITDNTVADENTLDFTYTYNPLDNLPNDNLGDFDVKAIAKDNSGASSIYIFANVVNFENTDDYIFEYDDGGYGGCTTTLDSTYKENGNYSGKVSVTKGPTWASLKTTTKRDFSGYDYLRFWTKWQSGDYGDVRFQISTDNSNWTTLWSKSGSSGEEIIMLDISSYQNSYYIRLYADASFHRTHVLWVDDVGLTNNIVGWKDVFVVDDSTTPINFSPLSPYYRWEENASGTISRIIGTASADNVWYKDAVEGTWYLGSGNDWSKEYTINSSSGENVTVTVTIWDPPLDGKVTSSYVVNENWKFWLNLKWEENFGLVSDNTVENVKNWWAEFIHVGAETVKVNLDASQYEFIDTVGEPLFVRIQDRDENYYRTYRTNKKEIDVYMVTDNNLPKLYFYTIKLDDPSGQWGPPDGSITLYKYENATKVYINDAYWSGTNDTTAYLTFGEIYRIRLEGTVTTLEYGIFDADANTSRTISPGYKVPSYGADATPITDEVTWWFWWDTDNYLIIQYQDNLDNTNWVYIRITDENENVLYTDNVWVSSFQSTWTNGDPDIFYLIYLEIDHDLYGNPTSTKMNFGAMPAPIPQPKGSPSYLDVLGDPPVPWGSLIISGLFLLVIVSFGPAHAGIGAVMLGVTAALLNVLGITSIDISFIALIILFGVLIQALEARKGGS